MNLCVWLVSLRIMLLRFIHAIWYMSSLFSFLRNISLNGHTIIYSFSYWGTFGLFEGFGYQWITLLGKWVYKSLSCYMFSSTLGKYLELESLGLIEITCLILKEISKLFSKMVIPLYVPTSTVWRFWLLHYFANQNLVFKSLST